VSSGNPDSVGEIKEEFDHAQRKAARGRAAETPVLTPNILLLVLGAFVGLVVRTVRPIYYFA
jgi:hypothetical protein